MIIASKFCPLSIFQSFKDKLGFSGNLVVYSEARETLTELYMALRKDAGFINVHLSESWMREYQAHPGRMHPQMMTSSNGGFILTAIKVDVGVGEKK